MITKEEYDSFIELQDKYYEQKDLIEAELSAILADFVMSKNRPDLLRYLDNFNRITGFGKDFVKYNTFRDDYDEVLVRDILNPAWVSIVNTKLNKFHEDLKAAKDLEKQERKKQLLKELELIDRD